MRDVTPDTEQSTLLADMWQEFQKLDDRLPEKWTLNKKHRNYLYKRGVDTESAAWAGIFSAKGDLAFELVGRRDPCLIFPYWEPGGRKLYTWENPKTGLVKPFYRARLDIPDGKQKFTSPLNSRVFPYWPRVQRFNWVEKPGVGHSEPSSLKGKDCLFTEGEAKALSGTIHGFPTIGLGGVWGWKEKKRDGEETDRLLPELREFNWTEPRRIIGVYDSDASHNPMVVQAMQRFGKCLIEEWEELKSAHSKKPNYYFADQLNKRLFFILLPTSLNKEKLGLDDFLVKFGKANLEELTDKALPLQSIKIDKSINLKVTSHYTGELLGPYTPAKGGLDKVLAMHYRGLLTKFTLASDVCYVPDHGGMRYSEDKGIWEPVSKGAWSLLTDTVCRVNNWQNRKPAVKTENFELAREELAISFDNFNHPKYIGFRNGVMVTETDNTFFIGHSREHYLTRRLGFDYDREAKCPKFEAFLEGMCGGRGTLFWAIRSLFRWSLEPKQKNKKYGFEVWPILVGPPGSGKSTLLHVLQALVGFEEGCATFTIKSLSSQEPEKKLAKLHDKYVAMDPDYKGHLSETTLSIINRIVSNEPVEIKRLWQDECSVTLNVVLWAAANKTPSVSNGDGEGFSRRAMLLPIKPRKGEAKVDLATELLAELPGIYNWVMQISLSAAISNIRQFKESKVALDTHQQWIIENNTAIAWLHDWVFDSTEEERNGYYRDFYSDYQGWCGREGHKSPLKSISFSKYLVAAGMEKVKRNGDFGWWVKLPEVGGINWKGIG